MKILIKLSGKIIDESNKLDEFISQIKRLYFQKNKIIIVHGGGKQVSLWMKKLNLEPRFVNGLRYTDEQTLDIVINILCGLINKYLVKKFLDFDIKKVVGLSCIDGYIITTDINKELGFVGRNVKNVNLDIINLLLRNGYLILLSSVGIAKENKKNFIVNINADDVIYAIGEKMKFDKIIFLSDVEGIMDKNKNTIKFLNIKDIDNLINQGIVSSGMIPKVLAIKKLLKKGIKKIVVSNSLNKEATIIKI